jgi:hypothetical protein
VLLPVEIPPVIPIAGIQVSIKTTGGLEAVSVSTSATICQNRVSRFKKRKKFHAVNPSII